MDESGGLEQAFHLSIIPYDQQAGLVYSKYRFYMPQVGPSLSKDPLVEVASVIESDVTRSEEMWAPYGYLNLYTYAQNSPPNILDPNGKQAVIIWILIVVILANAVGQSCQGVNNGGRPPGRPNKYQPYVPDETSDSDPAAESGSAPP